MQSWQSELGLGQDESQWMSVSDLMAGLMIVFLFVAVALMRDAMQERDTIKEIAVAFQEDQKSIYNALVAEFDTDLKRWNAEIDKDTLTFTFNSPDVLFRNSEKTLSLRYKALLQDFFPRYMDVLNAHKHAITEVRIEGHTSSVWNSSVSQSQAYFNNMRLSQDRTRSVLEYVHQLPALSHHNGWITAHVAAVGYSSSKPILDRYGQEDKSRSRRVAFRVISDAERKIKQILSAQP